MTGGIYRLAAADAMARSGPDASSVILALFSLVFVTLPELLPQPAFLAPGLARSIA
jgi:hypothetical protein